ncbi:hypothetical protein YTPLAS21_06990 [Candidatus Nitrosocosmicus sp.]|nr:hypothetical protein YTPLAS21_06990 [Candidatus Nitrosocosmicus sp.]
MFRILLMVLIAPLIAAIGVSVYASSGPGGVFDSQSDSNADVSFLPGKGNMTFTEDNVTVGQEKALNNTIGNTTEFNQPGFDPSAPLKEYESNSSDWTIIDPFDKGRYD